jgi:translation initiation factor 2 subunit 3
MIMSKGKEIIQPEVNIGMIGHVDHGKTSLTKALTGTWTDTHSEELKRGISIRLGYADATFYKMKTAGGEVYANNDKEGKVISKRIVSFVDAPGHETLMTTMLSGAALMNGAVLVIAANEECPQPRTIEHLMALKFAGVENIIIAQNKMDLVSREDVLKNYEKIKKFLKDYGYEKSPIIPTSANFGANIDLLIDAIENTITTPKGDSKKPLKMFVARSFDINKPGAKVKDLKGAVIGGSISQGIVKVGEEVEICPGLSGKTKTKVISLATNAGLINEAHSGGLIAIGTTLDPSIAQNDQLRGRVIAKPGSLPDPVKEIKVKVHMFERMVNFEKKDAEVKINDPLVLTIGTNTNVGFATKVEKDKITLNLKNEEVVEKGEKIALSKNINSQWRLIAFGEIQ